MNDASTERVNALIVPGDHGSLHGCLSMRPNSIGLVVLVHADLSLNPVDGSLALALRNAGFSTLSVDLIAPEETHFPDMRNNVPLLAKRLLLFLDQIRHRMQMGEIETQALALHAVNDTAPVIVRIASQRDHDIAALVCHGGLIDLAGMLYLHSLSAPILLLHPPSEERHIAANRRAFAELRCPHELRIIPESAPTTGTDTAGIATQEAVAWFVKQLRGQRPPAD